MDVHFTDDGATVVAFVRWSRWAPDPPPDGYRDTIFFLDAATGEEVRTTTAPACFEALVPAGRSLDLEGPVFAVSAVPIDDGCDNLSMEAGMMDLESGEFRALTESVDYSPIGWASASADGRLLAVGMDGSGQVVDVASGETLLNIGPGLAVLSEDGGRVISGGMDTGAIAIIDVATGEPIVTLSVPGEIAGARWSADGSAVWVWEASGAVHLMDALSGEPIVTTRPSTAGVVEVVPDATDRRLAVFTDDGVARVLDVADRMQGEIASFAVVPEGERLVSVLSTAGGVGAIPALDFWTGRSTVTVFDTIDGTIIRRIDAFLDAPLSADGSVLAIQPMLEDVEVSEETAGAGFGGTYQRIGPIAVVDVETGARIAEMEGLCEWFNRPDNEVPGPDCGSYPAPFADYGRLALSADGSRLALGGWISGSVTLWDAGTGTLLWNSGRLEEEWSALDVGFTADGSRLVAGSKTAMHVFATATGEQIAQAATENNFYAMAFSPDGRRLFATEGDGVRVFETTDWSEVDRFDVGPAFDLAVSPDGAYLAVGTRSEYVIVLDPETGAVLQTVRFPGVEFPAEVAFVDADHLAVASFDTGPVVVVSLDPAELVDIARGRITRAPFAEECEQYALEPCPTLTEIGAG